MDLVALLSSPAAVAFITGGGKGIGAAASGSGDGSGLADGGDIGSIPHARQGQGVSRGALDSGPGLRPELPGRG